MNQSDDRSMSDVLASIRRIVRAEEEGSVAAASDDGHAGETGEDRRGDDRGPPYAEELLVLTPEMRTDVGAGVDAGAGAGEADAGASGRGEAAELDREALRSMLRELLQDELSGGKAEGAVREIIRDELTEGQVGSNISQNVLRLIRAEVAKALAER